MNFKKEIKLIHWNIHKNSKDDLFNKMKKQEADIIVFSEFPKLEQEKENKIHEILNPKYQLCILGKTNKNGIAIYRSTELENDSSIEWVTESIHPDCVCTEVIYDKKTNKTIKIAGIRFQTSNMTPEDKINQILNFMYFVKEHKPDIIIGDLNWNSAIHGKRKFLEKMIEECSRNEKKDLYTTIKDDINELKIVIKKRKSQYLSLENPESTFCSIMDKVRNDGSWYVMNPTDNEKNWSKLAIRGNGGTNPDRVVYNSKKIELCTSGYDPEINLSESFPEDWVKNMSDHAMHKVTIKIKG